MDDLYQRFRKEFHVTSTDSKRNSWYKWSHSIVDAAKFMNEFSDVSDFEKFVGTFDYNVATRMALPLLISTKISGVGFALACDLFCYILDRDIEGFTELFDGFEIGMIYATYPAAYGIRTYK